MLFRDASTMILFSIVILAFSAKLSQPAATPPPKNAPTTPKGPPKIPVVPEGFSFKSEMVQPKSTKLPLNLIRTAEQW